MIFRRRCHILLLALLLTGTSPSFADTQADDLHPQLENPSPELTTLDLPKDELSTLYASRNFKPAWSFATAENSSAATAYIGSLEHYVLYHGLRTQAYPFEAMRNLLAAKNDKSAAQLDILVTASLLRLAHDLHGDMVDLDEDYPGWNFHRSPLDIPALLAAAIASNSANDFVNGLAPKNPAYTKLASALRTYRAYADKGGWARIDGGAPLRPGDHGPRVAQVRARLVAEDYADAAPASNDVYDDALAKTVAAYQTRNGVEPDGHIGDKTLEAMNTPVTVRIHQIEANMERWRHMPDDFPPERYTTVNIADATIRIVEAGQQVFEGPVVVGKVDRKTPFIQSRIRSMIVNPSWHVPAKIARKDILPKLRKDPHYLEKLGFVISGHGNNPHGEDIDWASMPDREFNYQLRQEPGAKNSLGHLKFDFDNDFAVYMHGTPHHELFAKAQRNYSSGCIRLRDPDLVGAILLKETPGHWDTEKIQSEVDDKKTRWVAIANPMPLYVLYWSVFVDDTTGAVNFRKDVYDYDRILDDQFVPEAEDPQK